MYNEKANTVTLAFPFLTVGYRVNLAMRAAFWQLISYSHKGELPQKKHPAGRLADYQNTVMSACSQDSLWNVPAPKSRERAAYIICSRICWH